MPRVFISNTKVQETEEADFIFSPSKGVEQLLSIFDSEGKAVARKIDLSGSTTFVIDVHCTFAEAKKMQQQGGIIIYRHLLKIFGGNQEKLKVVFYSPIPKEDLVKLKPENYVLSLLPFVECKYESKEEFEGALQRAEIEVCPQFNNASENLLSGWALAGVKKIDLKQQTVLAIDDQFAEWQNTYNSIFSNCNLIAPKYKSQRGFKDAWKNGDAIAEIKKHLENADIIISDLYLYEAHESDIWKNPDYIKNISGYKVFEEVRKMKPAMPVIFHSSSNKIRNYKNLTALICDGYVVKDIRIEPSNSDKLNTFTEFETTVGGTINEFGHAWVNELFSFLQKDNSSKWWVQRINTKYAAEPIKAAELIKEFTDLLKYILLAYKQLLNQNTAFTKLFYSGAVINPYSFTVANIIHSCGRLDELMDGIRNVELEFLKNLRHQAAHAENYHLYQINDAKIAIALLFKTLSNNSNRPISDKFFIQPEGREKEKWCKYYHQLFSYTSYYNKFYSFLNKDVLPLFEKRLRYYTMEFFNERWKKYTPSEKNHVLNSYSHFKVDNTIKDAFMADTITINGKCTIKFKN